MKKLVALLIVGLCACSKTQSEPTPTQTSSASPTTSSAAPSPAGGNNANGITWDTPVGWQPAASPTTGMRKATYKVDDTEVAVTSSGGGVEQNAKRWQDQFGGVQPKTEKKKVGGVDATIIELHGTFNGGMMGGKPGAGQAMLGAIVETQPELTFFKMVGSDATIEKNREAFVKMIESVKKK